MLTGKKRRHGSRAGETMIPPHLEDWIFPQFADGTDEAAVLRHACGIEFQFVANEKVVTNAQLREWGTTIDKLATVAGHNCFFYNTLEPTLPGVYHDTDGNTFAILFTPATFLEHNDVDGEPLFLVISESDCILTGSKSEAGMKLLYQHLPAAMADSIVTIDKHWNRWIALDAE